MTRFGTALLFVVASGTVLQAGNWPAWRGPQGIGVADEPDLPVRWSSTENVKWKTPLPGPGNSTPIVWNDRVFITQAGKDGKERSLICFDRDSGKPRWQQSTTHAAPEKTHDTNPQCASSPVTDGEVVAAWHGSAGLFVYDLGGKPLWQKDLGTFEHIWGYGSSPVLFENLLIQNAGPGLRAFVVAFDKQTGGEVWRREFSEAVSEKVDQFRGSWNTPVFYKEGDRTLMLLHLPSRLHALDPRTGESVWHCDGLGELAYTSPLVSDDGRTVVTMSGYKGPSMAVRTGGRGDVTATHRLWHNEGPKLNPQRVGTGVIVGDHVYILQDSAIAWCLELATGRIVWEERLGKSWSSMVHAGGRIYAIDMKGTTFVLDPSPEECKVLAENRLDELTRSSPAFSDGQIFIRTYENLYCIE